MSNNLFNIQQMISIANEMNNKGYECRFVDNYSGRGMYGKTCVGFITDDVFEVECRVKERGIKAKAYEDNMGLSYIVYYPSISFETKD